ncbi:MAG: hypothetical protein KUG78_17280 [Kangiellaceae bacterium]|nr:hypothetical protein [Kangiellaceae bacterium]
MATALEILASKKWNIDLETSERLCSLINTFMDSSEAKQLTLIDIKQFSSYFVTHVYKLVCKDGRRTRNYYAKFAYLPKGHEKRQRERIKYEYDYTAKIYDLLQSSECFDSVKPIDFYPVEGAFVMAEMQGERLDIMLVNAMKIIGPTKPDKLYDSMKQAGSWLAYFQKNMPMGNEKRFTSEQLLERIRLYLKKVDAEDDKIISKNLSNQLIDKTTKVLEKFQKEDFLITAKHNDFAPWNLMKGEGSIIGFDYADCEFDSRYYDVYHFTRSLNTFKLKPIRKKTVIEGCKDAFLEGYGESTPLDHPTRIYFNIFFSLERIQMLLRAKKRNLGAIGRLKTLSQKRHLRWYLSELSRMENL